MAGYEHVKLVLSYNPNNPYFVKMTFPTAGKAGKNVIWEAPRQILTGGLTEQTGYNLKSSVTAMPFDGRDDLTQINLLSQNFEPYSFMLKTSKLAGFLARTENCVPSGRESSYQLPLLNDAVAQAVALGAQALQHTPN